MQVFFKPNLTSPTHQYSAQKTAMIETAIKAQRTHADNDINVNSPKHTFFSDSSCKIVYNYNFSASITLYVTSSSQLKICDCRFGVSINENFVIVFDSGMSAFVLMYFSNNVLLSQINVTNSTLGNYYLSKVVNNCIYILVESGLFIYTADRSLTFIKSFPLTVNNQISFDVNSRYLILGQTNTF